MEQYRDNEEFWCEQTQALRANGTFPLTADPLPPKRIQPRQCTVEATPGVWYLLQVLHCSRVNIQRMHRVFAVFIWGSSWERTSRTNLFRRVKNGGLGLSHLFVRQLVNRFIFLRDEKDSFFTYSHSGTAAQCAARVHRVDRRTRSAVRISFFPDSTWFF
ncbi:unnamed protein product [Ixodes hexagonus]